MLEMFISNQTILIFIKQNRRLLRESENNKKKMSCKLYQYHNRVVGVNTPLYSACLSLSLGLGLLIQLISSTVVVVLYHLYSSSSLSHHHLTQNIQYTYKLYELPVSVSHHNIVLYSSLSLRRMYFYARSFALTSSLHNFKQRETRAAHNEERRDIYQGVGREALLCRRLRRARGKKEKKKKTREGRLRYYAALSPYKLLLFYV